MDTFRQTHPALALLREDPARFATQGTVVETWRTYRGRRLGPYYRLTWRENGRQRAIYLGRQSPLVDEVRSLLHEAQTIRRMIREHRRRQALFREHVIRPLQQYVKEMFRLFGNGLYVKGSSIGGIKTAGPRLTTADVPEHLIPEFPVPPPHILAQLHATPKHKQEQPTSSPHTNPKRERGQRTPFSNALDRTADSSAVAPQRPKTSSENRPCRARNKRISVPSNPPSQAIRRRRYQHPPANPPQLERHRNTFRKLVDQ